MREFAKRAIKSDLEWTHGREAIASDRQGEKVGGRGEEGGAKEEFPCRALADCVLQLADCVLQLETSAGNSSLKQQSLHSEVCLRGACHAS